MRMSKDNTKFSISFTIAGAFLASFSPFLVPYFTDLGYSSSEIAFFLSVYNAGIIISFPIIGFLNDKYFTMKKMLLILIVISIFATIIYLNLSNSPMVILMYLLALSFFQKPIFGLLETYTTKMSQKFKDIDFGIPRGFSSLGYAITSLFIGSIVANLGFNSMLYSQMFFLGALFISILFLKNFPLVDEEEVKKIDVVPQELPAQNSFKNAVHDLLRNRNYILLVLCASFFTISSVGFSTYLPIVINSAGGNTKELGFALFLTAISEVPIMFFFRKINRKFNINVLLLFSCIVNTVKMLIPVLLPSLATVFISQVLQAFSYAIFVPSIYLAIYKSVKPENSSFAISIAITLYSSIFGTLAVYFSGILLDHISIWSLLIIFAISTSIATFIMAFKIIKDKKEKNHD